MASGILLFYTAVIVPVITAEFVPSFMILWMAWRDPAGLHGSHRAGIALATRARVCREGRFLRIFSVAYLRFYAS